MKQFITSRILRKMLILATLTCALVFVHFSGNTAVANICCEQCEEIEAECLLHLGEYKSLEQCMAINGPGCPNCEPECPGCMPNCP